MLQKLRFNDDVVIVTGAAWVCKPEYSLSVSVCSAGSTSRANSLMFFSVRSPGRVANCSIARKFWKPSSR